MTMTKTRIGTKPDGTPHYDYKYDGPADGGILITGPVSGSVTVSDGTTYDVTPEAIEFHSGHHEEIMYRIAKIHEASGYLTTLVHGVDYDGPQCVIIGADHTDYKIGHEGDADDIVDGEVVPPAVG